MPNFVGIHCESIGLEKKISFQELLKNVFQKSISSKPIKITDPNTFIIASFKEHESKQENILIFPNHSGVLLGRLYPRHPSKTCIEDLIKQDFSSIREKKSKFLSENYWGRYIIILFNENNQFEIFRDPTGQAQVYILHYEGLLLFSSELFLIVEIAKLLDIKLNYNWEYFCSYLSYGPLNTASTPLVEIIELLPGSILTKRNHTILIQSFWDPTKFLSKQKKHNIDEQLIAIYNQSINAMLKNTSGICLQLSGGLDSTALFLAIQQQIDFSQHYMVVNYREKSVASSDETEYVNRLVEGKNIELIYHTLQYDFRPNILKKWDRPHPALLGINLKQKLLNKLNLNRIDLINGHGGDQLFMNDVSSNFLTDFIIEKGLTGSWKLLKKISMFNRTPMFFYLRNALQSLLRHLLCIKPNSYTSFDGETKDWFTNDLLGLINPKIYKPLFWDKLTNSHIPPGKIEHILDVYHASSFSNFEFPHVTEIYPYLFQPLVEFGLSIPVYKTFNEHWSRLHFREAMASAFDTNFVWRRSKGECSGVMQQSICADVKRVEELCLEGNFSRENLIHKDKLRQHIHLMMHGQIENQWLVLQLICLELWFEGWSREL